MLKRQISSQTVNNSIKIGGNETFWAQKTALKTSMK